MYVDRLEKNSIKSQSLFRVSLFLFLASILTACGGSSSSSNSNAAPTIDSAEITAATEDAAYSYTFAASDVDTGDTLTLSAPVLPTWLAFNAGTGELSGTPLNADVGDHNVTLRVNDGTVDVDQSFVITVANTNDVPTIDSTEITAATEDAAYSYTFAASDVDTGDTLTLSAPVLPTWLAFNAGTGELSGTPLNADVGDHNVTLRVNDGTVDVDQVFVITVANTNDVAVANNDSVTMNEKRTINIDLVGNDTDVDVGDLIDPATIIITNQPINEVDDTVTVNGDGTVSYTHDGSNTTSDSFTYTVMSDDGSTSNEATVNITVLQGFNEAMFARPTVSDSTATGRISEANDGLSGDATNGWEAPNIPAGQWITLTFDSPRSIYRVFLADLVDLTNQVDSATIEFSNGDSIAVGTLPNDGTWTEGVNDFVFAPKLVSWIKVTLHTSVAGTNLFGLSEINAYSALEPGQKVEKTDKFNDGDVSDWTTVDDCLKAGSASDWKLENNRFVQQGNCRGFSPTNGGVEHGTHQVLNAFNIQDMDLRIRIKSDDNPTDYWKNGAIGIVFAYRSLTDYYRLDISQVEGHTKLWKKVAGTFTELATSPISLTPDDLVNLRIVRKDGVIVIYKDDVKVMAVEDNTGALNNNPYQIGLFCARNEDCVFDSMVVLSSTTTPIVGANIDDDGVGVGEHTSGEYFVDAADSLDINAVVTDDSAITGVEFVVDEGTGSEVSYIDADGAPYTANFSLLTTGDHNVNVYLRDGLGRLSGDAATEELPQVGTGGIHLVGLGDSITGGLQDDVSSDDTSSDGRNTSGGYQPVLNDLLTVDNGGMPVTVLNEGNPGEAIAEASTRIAAVLERTPAAQAYLTIFGANDVGAPTPHGLGTVPNTVTPVTFKDYMQKIIDAVQAAGKEIILGKAPPRLDNVTYDARIAEFNAVISELVTENGFSYTPPDFHAYLTANSVLEMNADNIHPNGIGYQSMANLWCTAINGITELPGVLCSP